MEELLSAKDEDQPPSLSGITTLFEADRIDQSYPQPYPWLNPETNDWGLNDWRYQMANRLRTPEALLKLLKLKPQEAELYKKLIGVFHYSITPYYLSLIDWSNPEDPIKKQCVPDIKELDFQVVGDNDPLEEEDDMQVPGLVHRYPDRVLAIVTSLCSVYCRHCTRKRIWHEGEAVRTKKELLAMADYIRKTPSVREVVISGGDPLTMSLDLLDWFLGELRTIPHLDVMRIGTRVPVVMPMRVTDDLAQMLRAHRPLWINTQFNHPSEITPQSAEACDRLLSAGIPVSNQSVLLKGINDSVETMKALCHGLQKIMVRPYYLYQCDPVTGVEHFRTSVWKGIEIIEQMRGYTGGLCVPSFVVDAPGGGGKIPLQPSYLLSMTDNEVMLRNYEGIILKYYNPRATDQIKTFKPKRNGNSKNSGADSSALPTTSTPRLRRRLQKQDLPKLWAE